LLEMGGEAVLRYNREGGRVLLDHAEIRPAAREESSGRKLSPLCGFQRWVGRYRPRGVHGWRRELSAGPPPLRSARARRAVSAPPPVFLQADFRRPGSRSRRIAISL